MTRFHLFFLSIAFSVFFVQPVYATVLLDQKIGQMIVLGFHGQSKEDAGIEDRFSKNWVQKIHKNIEEGSIGGVILFQYNITGPEQLKKLTAYLENTKSAIKPWIAVDCEGGKVERLSAENGFRDFPSAALIGKKSFKEAAFDYKQMADMLMEYGINLNFGPVVDLDFNSPIIGGRDRSYGKDPEIVIRYAQIFMDAMQEKSILTTLKHFPGHGSAKGDTHKGFVDATRDYQELELTPYQVLATKADGVMIAHIVQRRKDPAGYPASLSKKMIDILRNDLNFQGLIVSDDLHMTAIQQYYNLKETVLTAIRAGVDVLVFSNNSAAAAGLKNFKPDPDLAYKIIQIVKKAIQNRELDEKSVDQAYARIINIKKKYGLVH